MNHLLINHRQINKNQSNYYGLQGDHEIICDWRKILPNDATTNKEGQQSD